MPALPWDLAPFCPLNAPTAPDKVHETGTDIRSGDTTLVIETAGAERTPRVCEALGYTRVR